MLARLLHRSVAINVDVDSIGYATTTPPAPDDGWGGPGRLAAHSSCPPTSSLVVAAVAGWVGQCPAVVGWICAIA